MSKSLALAAILASIACAQPKLADQPLGLENLSHVTAPPPWDQVALGDVHGLVQPRLRVLEPPENSLRRVLEGRLGPSAGRAVVLSVQNLWITAPDDNSMRLGLSADFILEGPRGRQVLRVEHSVDLLALDESTEAYTRLYEDVADLLFGNNTLLTYLGTPRSAGELPPDTALQHVPSGVGPIQPAQPLQTEVQATGRMLWGHTEHGRFGAGTLILGDLTGFFGVFLGRDAKIWSHNIGGALRVNAGLGAVSAKGSGGGNSTSMFGLQLGVGGELGYFGTKYDELGYVDAPGPTLVLVPQMQMQEFFASSPAGSGTMTLLLMQFGGGPEVDIPIGHSFGITAGAFFGAAMTSLTAPPVTAGNITISIDASTGPDFLWYPYGDLYIQTASSRISLGLAFQQAAAAFTQSASSILNNPKFTLTYQEREGRGLAYKHEELAGMGLSQSQSEVLSGARSAFYNDDGQPVASPPRMPLEPPPAFTPPPPPVATAGRWVILPTVLNAPGLSADTAKLTQSILTEVVTNAHGTCVPDAQAHDALTALGLTTVTEETWPDYAGAVGATSALQLSLQMKGDQVTLTLHRFDKQDTLNSTVSATTPRQAMLRVLREKAAQIVLASP